MESGETLVVETQDAHGGSITSTDVVYRNLDEVFARLGGANPVTGPIAIAGAEPGDYLEIDVSHVEGAPLRGFGHMTTTPTLHPDLEPETTICYRQDDYVTLPTIRGSVLLPYRPFVGTLGVAPATDPVPSFGQRRDILGNVDLPELTNGATVVLRVQVAGGMLSLGDAHLVQGDAEIHRSAVETQADVTLTVRARSVDEIGFAELPQVNGDDFIGSIAPGPGHLEDLVRAAYDDLVIRLERFYGYSKADAYRLLGAVGKVRIGQVVPPVYSALAKVERKYLETEAR
ncbi:MAG TPA: acetamidase/formamidase family protein [Acidimicrobiia bacterium]|nr:acetamidase/formamidase family protein [Acidimicrobiia bacterium]